MGQKLANQYIQRMAEMQTSTITDSCDGSGETATAKLYPSSQIVVAITVGTAGKMITVTLETPIAFQVIDAKAINSGGTVGTFTVSVKNDSTSITDDISVNGDKAVARATEIDEDQDTFAVDDDDLVVTVSGSSTGSILVVIDILLV